MWRGVLTGALVAATLVAVYLVGFSLRFDANVSALLPARGEAAALRQYLRAFGGSDLSLVLIEGEGLGSAGAELAAALEAEDAVEQATAGLSPRTGVPVSFLWRHADASARERLGRALTEPGMRERLRTSRAMLLAPGGSAAAESLPSDPLRLAQLFADHPYRTGFQVQPDGSFANDEGTAQLVLVFPRGQSLRSDDAKAFVGQAEAVLAKFRARYPDLRFRLTGGHAIGAQTERMLRRDLTWSSSLSMFLASIAFLFTFRRLRALVAVMPPLALGTLWTTAAAAAFPEGLSGIAIAFMSVVIGVGVDTGVHVYAALLEARAEGMTPREAAVEARRRAARPTLVAAGTAGFAFGALALSDIAALRQLGILCAVGEVVTAVAIVLVTPEIGAWLERDEVRARPAGWTRHVAALTQTRARALIVALVVATPLLALELGLRPAV
ncbi:MAG: MMPL family transporter, partial [Myxococcota bacterium]